jgi:hypothetical protein
MGPWHGLALASGLLLSSSCVQVSWERHELNTAFEEGVEQQLAVGEVGLQDCLSQLGAPLMVWELNDADYALAYGWDQKRQYGISFSVPVANTGGSASLNYDDLASKLYGVVLIFDAEDRLVRKRRGLLRDLAPDEDRRRPFVPQDDRWRR